MKKLVLFLMVSFSIVSNLLGQNNTNNFTIIDSSSLFSKVDSLKKDEHTEFALTLFSVAYNTQEELDLTVNNLGNLVYPEGFVLYHSNNTYYPKTEYINDETDKKFNQTFIYVDKTGYETVVYLLSSGKIRR
jgi:hypothetical protein